MNVAVPMTVPEGCVGRAERRVRVNDQVEDVRVVNSVRGKEGPEGGWLSGGLVVLSVVAGSEVGSLRLSLCKSEAGGCGRSFQFELYIDRSLISGSIDCGGSLDISTLLTLCSVARLGLRAGLLVVIQLRRCLMNVLSISLVSLAFCKFTVPVSLTYRHR